MGCRTPNIDRVGNEGVAFTDYYAQQSCTAVPEPIDARSTQAAAAYRGSFVVVTAAMAREGTRTIELATYARTALTSGR